MRLKPPCQGIDFRIKDIYGKPFQLSDLIGKRVMLCFFRDAACPFCNLRIYELTHKYTSWKKQGLEIVTVFSSTSAEVRKHVANHPRPFRMISDPDLIIYNRYGIEHSSRALLKAVLFSLPRVIQGITKGGRPSWNRYPRIVPADFLLDEDGCITQLWYARHTSDHIPLSNVQKFINQSKTKTLLEKIRNLKAENTKLKTQLKRISNRKFEPVLQRIFSPES